MPRHPIDDTKRVQCPACKNSDELLVLPYLPTKLYPAHHADYGQPIATETTEVVCLHCYWKGQVRDLFRITSTCPEPLSVVDNCLKRLTQQICGPKRMEGKTSWGSAVTFISKRRS